MIIGTVKELKNQEHRVGLTPEEAGHLHNAGHKVFIEHGAGKGAGFADEAYSKYKATVVSQAKEVMKKVDLLVKIKEPLPKEYQLYRHFKSKILFTFLHLAGVEQSLTRMLLRYKVSSIGYETVEDNNGNLPLLAPMSDVAGVLAIQYGAEFLQKKYEGRGVTLGRIPGTNRSTVVIIGGGHVGSSAARTAAGLGCNVFLLEKIASRVSTLKSSFSSSRNVSVISSSRASIHKYVSEADLLIGAVLVAGGKSPIIVSEAMVKRMKKGAVIVDVAIDQGGCVAGSHATSHAAPVYRKHGVVYCCIPNMPGQASLQSTQALTRVTYPYILRLAQKGLGALHVDRGFLRGLQTYHGHITYRRIAKQLGMMQYYHAFTEKA